ncbi:MAG TPA: hypothetical protein VK982_15140 [Bacteroidales bacterium]|nr:hypothetical protein [Bacteroidales bacterium]
MVFLSILFIAIGALLIGAIFYYLFRSSGPWGSFWSFLLILILAGIAANVWISPVGPYYQGVAWFPVLFVILLFALLIAAATPSRRTRIESEAERVEPEAVALGGFFWILMIFLFIAVIWGIAIN